MWVSLVCWARLLVRSSCFTWNGTCFESSAVPNAKANARMKATFWWITGIGLSFTGSPRLEPACFRRVHHLLYRKKRRRRQKRSTEAIYHLKLIRHFEGLASKCLHFRVKSPNNRIQVCASSQKKEKFLPPRLASNIGFGDWIWRIWLETWNPVIVECIGGRTMKTDAS